MNMQGRIVAENCNRKYHTRKKSTMALKMRRSIGICRKSNIWKELKINVIKHEAIHKYGLEAKAIQKKKKEELKFL